jgi:hypothetical protein
MIGATVKNPHILRRFEDEESRASPPEFEQATSAPLRKTLEQLDGG